jgi:predicted transcriptional regulator
MAGDLLALAAKYVALTGEIEDVRRAMLACLANGAGDAHRPTSAGRPGAKKGSQPSHKTVMAAQAEERILELIREKPLRMTEIATEMGAKQNTTSERLRRLKAKGLVAPAEGGAWAASASA